MQGFTDDRASRILAQNITKDTYVCLSTTTPDKKGGNFTEPPASTGYVRRKIGPLNVSKPAQIANDDIIFLFEAVEDCGTFTHVGLADGTTGKPFLVGEIHTPLTVTVENGPIVPIIRAKKLVVGLDKETLELYD